MDETGDREGENANVWAADAYYRGDSDFINDKGEKSKWQKKKDYDEKDEGNKELKHMGQTVRLQTRTFTLYGKEGTKDGRPKTSLLGFFQGSMELISFTQCYFL